MTKSIIGAEIREDPEKLSAGRMEDLQQGRVGAEHSERETKHNKQDIAEHPRPGHLSTEHLEVERGRQHEPEQNADAAPDERQEVGEIGHIHGCEPDDYDEQPPEPPAVALAVEQPFGDLVDGMHHHRHGEEEVNAQPELYGGREPPGPEVGGDDVTRGVTERDVTHGAEEPVHDGDERHGQPERDAEFLLVGGLRLKRKDHADSLESVHGHAEAVQDRAHAAEGEDGWCLGEPGGHVLPENDAHGSEVDNIGEDAERREQRQRLDGVEPELERQHGPDEERLRGEKRVGGGREDWVEVRHGVRDEDEVTHTEAGLAEHQHGVDGEATRTAKHGVPQVSERGDLRVLVREAAAAGDEQHHAVEGERSDGEQQDGPRRPPGSRERVRQPKHAGADHRDEYVREGLRLRRQLTGSIATVLREQRRRIQPRGGRTRLVPQSHGKSTPPTNAPSNQNFRTTTTPDDGTPTQSTGFRSLSSVRDSQLPKGIRRSSGGRMRALVLTVAAKWRI
uniref:Uncharacterized protein n=1 Tax=Leersia perrieri TaxID=77586 RepID=A0A0D9VJB6_9ORYZ